MTIEQNVSSSSTIPFVQARFPSSQLEAKVYRGYSSAPPSAADILSRGATVEACSMLHETVHTFRRMHMLGGPLSSESKARRDEVIEQYSLSRVSSQEAAAIAQLSTPEHYAAMRHGGRPKPGYVAVSSEELGNLCQEIRAALVWRALQ